MDLAAEIAEILAHHNEELPQNIHLYCDALHIGKATSIQFAGVLLLTIFARAIIVEPDTSVTFHESRECMVGIYTPSIPKELTFNFKRTGQDTLSINPREIAGVTGAFIGHIDGEPKRSARNRKPDVMFSDYLSNLTDQGKLVEGGVLLNNE